VQNIRAVSAANGPNGELRCLIGGRDLRRVPFKGWVIIEPFGTTDGSVRSFCIMQRDEVRVTSIYAPCYRLDNGKRVGRSLIVAKDVQGYCGITATSAIRPPAEGQRTVTEIIFRFYDITDLAMRRLFALSPIFSHHLRYR
jgi:hypothetical protein